MTTPLTVRIAQAIGDPGSVLPRLPLAGAPESTASWAARAVVAVLTDTLALEPCHVTGMHSPDHHTRFVCGEQKSKMLDAVLAGLGLTIDQLPKRLHDNCHWCQAVPADEKYREQLRETYRWAGVDIPAELAEPGVDMPRDGDDDLVLKFITPAWQSFIPIWHAVRANSDLYHQARTAAALDKLEARGAVETREVPYAIEYRLPPSPVGDDRA